MANDAMKNVNELGFPFAYFEDTYQFAIKTLSGWSTILEQLAHGLCVKSRSW